MSTSRWTLRHTSMHIYDEEILGTSDTCSNCFGVIRVPTIRPRKHKTDQEYLTRNLLTTSVEWTPSEIPSRGRTVFCECGMDSPRDRNWEDVSRDHLKELLQSLIETLEWKAIQFDKKELVVHALQGYDNGYSDVDDLLRVSVSRAINRATHR